MIRRSLLAIPVLVALFIAPASSVLSAPSVPPEVRGAILLRTISYEHGFANRKGTAVIAIVGDSSSESVEDANAMAAVIAKLVEKIQVGGRPLSVVRVKHESKVKTQETLRAVKAEVIYMSQGLSYAIPDISAREGALVRIIVCGDGDDIKQGCALAVTRVGDKPQLLLNVKHANAAGLRFYPHLLRLANIVN